MIRVLHIVPRLDLTGVAKFVTHHWDRMDKNKFIFDFVNHGVAEDFHSELEQEGCQIHNLPFPHEIGNISYLRMLKTIIKNGGYDIIHIHTGHYTGFIAMMCKLWRIKSRIICHAHTTKCMNPSHINIMPIFRVMAKVFADQLFACGYKAGVFCFGKGSKFEEMHNSVDLSVFKKHPESEVMQLRLLLKIPEGAKVIGHIGAFSAPKNHFYLLKIIDYYIRLNSSAVFVLLGIGPDYDKVVAKSKDMGIYDNIRFVGSQKNVPLYLSMFDAFVLPSIHEGLPVVSAESQALGLKAIFSNTIDRTCDLGLGVMSFLPIDDASIPEWCNAIDREIKKPSTLEIKSVFENNRYEIISSVAYLSNLYINLAG